MGRLRQYRSEASLTTNSVSRAAGWVARRTIRAVDNPCRQWRKSSAVDTVALVSKIGTPTEGIANG
jgi:hypothetical protein